MYKRNITPKFGRIKKDVEKLIKNARHRGETLQLTNTTTERNSEENSWGQIISLLIAGLFIL